MITAQKAREMYEKSNARVVKYLDCEIEPLILKAVEGGKCQCMIHIGATPTYQTVQADPFQQKVMEELRKIGYKTKFGSYGDKYVPRGLADDEGNGPDHRNYGFEISW